MSDIFSRAAHGTRPTTSGAALERIIVKRLSVSDWASTTELHRAANSRAKRDDLHEALKALLARRVIRMRVRRNAGHDVTEFRLTPTEPQP